MNSIFYLFTSICSNVYMYKMKLVSKSQYTNYLFEDLLLTINAILPRLQKLYQFLKYNHGYCEILEVIYTGIH